MDSGEGDERYSGLCALVDAAARDMAAMPHIQLGSLDGALVACADAAGNDACHAAG
ncbi:hypothetical protein M885DRAFT_570495 [Pelagophyceae sp. CCMP2097]|nr:hypothetical protein M885DRAFT_570495 [Pelagophyceae sp. CCMP2097]